MTIATGIAIYVVIWWVVLFAVLPWGVRPPETLVPGQADGAPDNPRLVLKALVTTLVAGAIWGVIYLVIRFEWISFRDMVQ